MPSTPSSSIFYRNIWRLTERNKKRKNESLTNSHSNSDETINDYSSMPQQHEQLQRSVEASCEAQDVLSSKGFGQGDERDVYGFHLDDPFVVDKIQCINVSILLYEIPLD
ncbi:unnamed protein product [Brugia timori]|nr:unnamed protein product [Brugia timori]